MRGRTLALLLSLSLYACAAETDTPKPFELPGNVKTVDGVHYLTKTKKTELVCENFTLTRTHLDYKQESIDPETGAVNQVPETQLPRTGDSLRHPDKSYYLPKWKIDDYVEITQGGTTIRIENLPERIDSPRVSKSRVYVWGPDKCLPSDEVLISLYSGGNCYNACQAWAKVKFGPTGTILDQVAYASYAEYKAQGGLDADTRKRLNLADNVDYKNGRWTYDLSCQVETNGEPGQSLLADALPRLQAFPAKHEGEIETTRPLENGYILHKIDRFEKDFLAGEDRVIDHPIFPNMEQITGDMVSYKSLAIKGYGVPCEFCPGTRLDEYVFRSEDCAARWHQLALDTNTYTKTLGFIRRKDKTVVTTWNNAYFMADHLKDIEMAIFGDVEPGAFYQKAEGYRSPIYKR